VGVSRRSLEPAVAGQGEGPGRGEQEVQVAQGLSGDAGHHGGDVAVTAALYLPADERRQELEIEAGLLVTEDVLGDGRGVLA
jgi:hypothetical protein